MKKIFISLCLISFFLFCCSGVQIAGQKEPAADSKTEAAAKQSDPAEMDFGDYKSSTLTVKAWEALGRNDYQGVFAYVQKCNEMYGEDAIKQQKSLKNFAAKDKAFEYWALNDVGTCYFIQASAYEKMKDTQKQKETYQLIIDKYYYCQCWDTGGWFWHPGEVAESKLVEMEKKAKNEKK